MGFEPRERTESKHVLVVEDDAFARQTLATILKSEGHTVTTASNGQEALACLRALPCPGLILLDLMMPIMDGWEFCRHQAKDPRLAGIPVVILSAVDQGEPRSHPPEAAGYLRKPYVVEDVLRVVQGS